MADSLKVALAQLNPKVGDVSGNLAKVRLARAEAQKQGAEVAEGAKAGRFEARPDRRRCRLCPYRLACAEAL